MYHAYLKEMVSFQVRLLGQLSKKNKDETSQWLRKDLKQNLNYTVVWAKT